MDLCCSCYRDRRSDNIGAGLGTPTKGICPVLYKRQAVVAWRWDCRLPCQTRRVGAYYIVTDLDLRARFDLAVLHAELKRAGLHGSSPVGPFCGVWRSNYSSSRRCCRHPDEAIDELLGIIEGLREEARDQWDRCMSRRLDMGFECFRKRFCSRYQITAPQLRRLAELNASLVVTIYRNDKPKKTPIQA